MKLSFKRGQKGFTLIELMVVMAILAVLVAVVVPAVSGTTDTSNDAQVRSDASTLSTAMASYYGDSDPAATLTTAAIDLLGDANDASAEVATDRWPEGVISSVYSEEFVNTATKITILDTAGDIMAYGDGVGGGTIVQVNIIDGGTLYDGADTFTTAEDATVDISVTVDGSGTITAVSIDTAGAGTLDAVPALVYEGSTGSGAEFEVIISNLSDMFVNDRTAVNFAATGFSPEYLAELPAGNSTFGTTDFHNYLWVMEKIDDTVGANNNRELEIYKLVSVENTTELTYQQIY